MGSRVLGGSPPYPLSLGLVLPWPGAGHGTWGWMGVLEVPAWPLGAAWEPRVCPAGMGFQRSHRLNLLRLIVLLLVALAGIKFLFRDR